jgi:hypothetical protein
MANREQINVGRVTLHIIKIPEHARGGSAGVGAIANNNLMLPGEK